MSKSCRVLVLLAHPALERSRVNAALAATAGGIEGVTLIDLYERYPTFFILKEREQQRLLEHDVVVFQHPMYWYSAPALLKEWQDIVLEYGFAYGEGGNALEGKSLMNAFSSGSYRDEFEDRHDPLTLRQLMLPFERTARYCGMRYLPPFPTYAAGGLSPAEISKQCDRYAELLSGLVACRYDAAQLAQHETLAAALGGSNHE